MQCFIITDESRKGVTLDILPFEKMNPRCLRITERSICPPSNYVVISRVSLTVPEVQAIYEKLNGTAQGRITREQMKVSCGRDQLYAELKEHAPRLVNLLKERELAIPFVQEWMEEDPQGFAMIFMKLALVVLTELGDRYPPEELQ